MRFALDTKFPPGLPVETPHLHTIATAPLAESTPAGAAVYVRCIDSRDNDEVYRGGRVEAIGKVWCRVHLANGQRLVRVPLGAVRVIYV